MYVCSRAAEKMQHDRFSWNSSRVMVVCVCVFKYACTLVVIILLVTAAYVRTIE